MRFLSVFYLKFFFAYECILQLLFAGLCDFCNKELRIKDHRRLCFFCILALVRELRAFSLKKSCHHCAHPLVDPSQFNLKKPIDLNAKFSLSTIIYKRKRKLSKTEAKKQFCPACEIVLLKVDVARTLFANEKLGQKICYEYKFFSRFSYATLLAKWILVHHRDFLLNYDVVVIVLQSRTNMYKRGFCQVSQVMKIVSRKLSLPMAFPIKCLGSSQQHFLDWNRRRIHVKSRFIYRKRAKSLFSGKKVLIVDDICTSGATINHFVRLIKKNNEVKSIGALFFARSILVDDFAGKK